MAYKFLTIKILKSSESLFTKSRDFAACMVRLSFSNSCLFHRFYMPVYSIKKRCSTQRSGYIMLPQVSPAAVVARCVCCYIAWIYNNTGYSMLHLTANRDGSVDCRLLGACGEL